MNKRIGVVFPGYGEQFIGMGKDLYDESRVVQEFFEQAAGAVDINFVKLCFASSAEDISAISNAYLAIYLLECSLYELLRTRGLRPDFIAGYGIGEYAASFAARSLSFIDGIYFLNKYAQFYNEFIRNTNIYTVLRIAKGFTEESLQEVINEFATPESPAYIAAQNSSQSFFVAGTVKTIKKIQEYCIDHVIRKVKDIGPEYGLFCQLVDEIAEQLKLYYHKIQFKPLLTPIITNVDGVYVTTPEALQSAMTRKVNHKIDWQGVMQGFVGCDVIISVGPGKQLIEWFKESYPDKEYFMVMTLQDIHSISHLFDEESTLSVSEEGNNVQDLHEADLVNERSSDYDVEVDEEE